MINIDTVEGRRMQGKATTTGKRIFISYRRDDARGASGRIWDWLRIAFGREQVFRDVASIGPGKWRDKIDAALAESAVCLAVIGPRWRNATNGPRLAEEGDTVRHELVTALARSAEGLTLILTLVEGAKVPPRGKLPAQLHDLLEWNAYPLSEEGWEDDMRRLLGAVVDCTGQPQAADIDSLLSRVGEAEARMRALEQEKHLQADQVRALTDTVAALTRQLVERPATQRAGLEAALEALGRGDTSAAEAEFERVLEDRSAVAAGAAHEAATAARHIANLALLGDVDKALRYYCRACELDPGHAETWRLLGQACLTAGNTNEARTALTRALQEADKSGDTWDSMAALIVLGDLALRTENLGEALSRYAAALEMANTEATNDPASARWQRQLSVGHDRIGDVLVTQGDLEGALTVFRKSFAITEALTARDPANIQWQRDLSVSYEKNGDMLLARRDLVGALASFRNSFAITEALAARDPANTEWQHDLSVNHEKIGDVLKAQDDPVGALVAYRASLTIREMLVMRDVVNTRWQRNLSISYERIGDVLLALDDLAGALAAYRQRLTVCETLAARDPANTEWQRDLSVSHEKIGDVLLALRDLEGLVSYRASFAIRETLAAGDVGNTQWQRDLSVSHWKIGNGLEVQGNLQGALVAYQKGYDIAEALVARDPVNVEWQIDFAVSCWRLGVHAGVSVDERRDHLRRGLKILQGLKASGRLPPNQDLIGWFEAQLRELDKD